MQNRLFYKNKKICNYPASPAGGAIISFLCLRILTSAHILQLEDKVNFGFVKKKTMQYANSAYSSVLELMQKNVK